MDIPHYIHCICSYVDRHLGCFHFLAGMNNNTTLAFEYKFLGTCVFIFLGYMSCVDIYAHLKVELLGYMATMFNVLRTCQIFPKWLPHFTCPPAMCSSFSTSLPTRVTPNWDTSESEWCSINNYSKTTGTNWNIF